MHWFLCVFFFKQKTAYEMRISDWSSDVCSSDLAFVAALGGAANLASIDACTTRLRLVVADQGAADEARLRALGAKGFVRPSAQALQVVLGPEADLVATEMHAAAGPLGTVTEARAAKIVAIAEVTERLAAPVVPHNRVEGAADRKALVEGQDGRVRL